VLTPRPSFRTPRHHRETRPVPGRSETILSHSRTRSAEQWHAALRLAGTRVPAGFRDQIGPTEDDISLLWLTDSSQTDAAVKILQTNAEAAEIDQLLAGRSLEQMFDRPGLPANGGDPRTPDIIAQPEVGVVYTGSLKKQAEHGGFAPNDVEVMVLVSNPGIKAKVLGTPVETRQVAPTILSLVGLDPNGLDAGARGRDGRITRLQFKP
jgi:hypothetical protein